MLEEDGVVHTMTAVGMRNLCRPSSSKLYIMPLRRPEMAGMRLASPLLQASWAARR